MDGMEKMSVSQVLLWPKSNPIENESVGRFVSIGIWGKPGMVTSYSSMAVFRNEKLVAGTLYHNWQPEEGVVEMTSFSTDKRWLTKDTIRCMFYGPFACLGCQMIVLRVSERNTNMISIARKFGFSETTIPRLRGRNENEVIFWYTDDQWQASKYYKEA